MEDQNQQPQQPQQPQTEPQPPVQPAAAPLQPAQPAAQPVAQPQQPVPGAQAVAGDGKAADQVSWYRKYWWFAVIFLFAPFGLIIGLVLLLGSDTVYKKSKQDNLYHPISSKEKTILIVIAVILQGGSILSSFGG